MAKKHGLKTITGHCVAEAMREIGFNDLCENEINAVLNCTFFCLYDDQQGPLMESDIAKPLPSIKKRKSTAPAAATTTRSRHPKRSRTTRVSLGGAAAPEENAQEDPELEDVPMDQPPAETEIEDVPMDVPTPAAQVAPIAPMSADLSAPPPPAPSS